MLVLEAPELMLVKVGNRKKNIRVEGARRRKTKQRVSRSLRLYRFMGFRKSGKLPVASSVCLMATLIHAGKEATAYKTACEPLCDSIFMTKPLATLVRPHVSFLPKRNGTVCVCDGKGKILHLSPSSAYVMCANVTPRWLTQTAGNAGETVIFRHSPNNRLAPRQATNCLSSSVCVCVCVDWQSAVGSVRFCLRWTLFL